MSKILIIVGILALIGASTAIFLMNPTNNIPQEEQKIYSGPVRPTDNESHFRLTGETIPLEVKDE